MLPKIPEEQSGLLTQSHASVEWPGLHWVLPVGGHT